MNTGVLRGGVGLTSGGLEPIEDTANKGGDESGLGLGSSNGLDKGEKQSQVNVDAVLGLKLTGSLDTLPGRGNLDENSVLLNTLGLVKINDLKGLLDGGILVKGDASINLGRDTARDNLQDLRAKLDKENVQSSLSLLGKRARAGLDGSNSVVNEGSVLSLLRGGKDEGRVGGGILGLVLGDGCGEKKKLQVRNCRKVRKAKTNVLNQRKLLNALGWLILLNRGKYIEVT